MILPNLFFSFFDGLSLDWTFCAKDVSFLLINGGETSKTLKWDVHHRDSKRRDLVLSKARRWDVVPYSTRSAVSFSASEAFPGNNEDRPASTLRASALSREKSIWRNRDLNGKAPYLTERKREKRERAEEESDKRTGKRREERGRTSGGKRRKIRQNS